MAQSMNLFDSLNIITRVPPKIWDEITRVSNLCIGSAIVDAKLEKQDHLVINIGIGSLGIDLVNMNIKFVPSKDLKTVVKNAVTQGVDPLSIEFSEAVANKLVALCEEVI